MSTEYHREWRKQHPDYQKERYWKDPDKHRAAGRANYNKHKAKRLEASRAYYFANRDAQIVARRRRYKENPDQGRRYKLMQNYGITLEQRDAMIQEQGGLCKACVEPLPTNPRHVHTDHSHNTGQVRGIICHHCNLALGHVKDSVYHLNKLIAYLESFDQH